MYRTAGAMTGAALNKLREEVKSLFSQLGSYASFADEDTRGILESGMGKLIDLADEDHLHLYKRLFSGLLETIRGKGGDHQA